MIISHENKFVFIKTTKTAGTSIEIELSRLCGDSDVITPITPNDEIIRYEKYGKTPQNFSVNKAAETEYIEAIRSLDIANIENKRKSCIKWDKKNIIFYNHIPFYEAAKIEPSILNRNYIKVIAERDPIDRMVSSYYFSGRGVKKTSRIGLLYHVFKKARSRRFQNSHLYMMNGEVIADFIIRYDFLKSDFEFLCRMIGHEPPSNFVMSKHNYRKDKRHGRDILSWIEREWIKHSCRKELEVLRAADLER
jgi:hypothetical protein